MTVKLLHDIIECSKAAIRNAARQLPTNSYSLPVMKMIGDFNRHRHGIVVKYTRSHGIGREPTPTNQQNKGAMTVYEAWIHAQAGVVSGLVSAYWICLIVGGGLLVISVFIGGDADGDIGGDVDVDVDVEANFDIDTDAGVETGLETQHHGAGDLTTWFSTRFLVYFAAMFGVIGVALTHMSTVGPWWTLAWSVAGGLVSGQGVHQLLRTLKKNSGDSKPRRADYMNKSARVTMAITPPKMGEVAIQVGRAQRYIASKSKRADTSFKVGDTVAVVDYQNGICEVVSKEEYDFINEKF